MEFVQNTYEYRNWGNPYLRISFIGVLACTFFQIWGTLKQNRTLWDQEEAESLSAPMFSYAFLYFSACCLQYGLYKNSIALIANSAVALAIIPVLIGIERFKGFSRKEVGLFGVGLLMIPAMAMPYKETMFTLFLWGVIPFLFLQLWAVLQSENAEDFNPRYAVAYIITNLFWLWYGNLLDSVPLMVFNYISLAAYVSMLVLWWNKRRMLRKAWRGGLFFGTHLDKI